MSLDDIIKTRKGDYRVINVIPQGSGTMITIKRIEGQDEKYNEILGSCELFQVYNHDMPIKVVGFTDAAWLKTYIARYMSKRNLNQVLLKK